MRPIQTTLVTAISIVCFLVAGCTADPYREQIDALATPYIEAETIIGMSVGVVTPEGSYTYHYGATERGGPTPNDDTLYEIGSITKTMTGLLLAEGVTSGAYTLDTPVTKLLGGKAEVDPRITLRRLSIHTSGLPRVPSNLFPFDPRDPYAAYNEQRLLAYLESPSIQSEPGENASYSNLAVGLLGYALAEQAGKPYPELLRDRVLEPLDMRDTTVALSAEQRPRMAGPHNADGDPAHLWTLDALAGAGGVRSNIHDMMKYARAQLEPNDTPLTEAIRLSQSPQNREGEASFDTPMGLGWFIGEGKVLMHGGQTGGFKSLIFVSLNKQAAVIVLANTPNGYVESFAGKLRDAVIDGKPVEPPDLPAPIELPESQLLEYAGRYVLIGAGFLDVSYEDGRLYAKLSNQPRFRLYPQGEETFRYRAVEASIDFERDEASKVVRLILRQDGRDIMCPRVPDEDKSAE